MNLTATREARAVRAEDARQHATTARIAAAGWLLAAGWMLLDLIGDLARVGWRWSLLVSVGSVAVSLAVVVFSLRISHHRKVLARILDPGREVAGDTER